ncbi:MULTISPECIES: Ldh family oxidoreductase [Bradyrhizobium]|nr:MULTISPECIES: Ldh family oxidoreductase [Bradyrhizobium]MCG2629478.1 Ldh family oxidoreductase [Bradyrhizobium zhengyangense]MCG2644894.1 Ldh family oxidoreductase [Bradyrhizobium zhengyangense]MCG2670992.1 Ldh family oxidoreductase [Bradyrhizobium zhengyangense]MDN4984627.1 Ldh family oxidoreductase [Bradyrhizobium sp. WYCCWR 13022]MDN5002619.1 Ldh family oxidoreductase [Bradyrhizobium sp. WYCCWR 12677]
METINMLLPPLEAWVATIFARAGLGEDDARLAARRLLLADITGVRTHGIARLPSYWRQLARRGLNPRPDIKCGWHGTVLVIDADLGLGQIVGPKALALAMDALGPTRPFVPFLIRNAGHLGAVGSHLLDVAESGRVGFLSQVTQPVMAPGGATRPAIGNNPIAFAAPRPDGPPLLIDFAMSNVARGKIHVALRDGLPIPEGWAIDAEGRPTTDPTAALAGSILPAAGHKGLALAMIVEVLAGVLTGARPLLSEGGAPGGVGAFGFVFDPAALIGKDAFDQNMQAWTQRYLAAVGGNGRIPGERAAELRAQADQVGIAIERNLFEQLAELGREGGAVLPA